MDKASEQHYDPATTKHIALIAHDLRNIINGIYGINKILKEKLNGQTSSEIQELIELISKHCELVVDFTTAFILSYKKSNFNLNRLLKELWQTFKHRADRKDIALALSLPDKEIYVQTERIKLMRILDNLLDNALKYTHRHGCTTISLVQKDNNAVIAIHDTGIGIPQHMHAVLFNKYPQIQRKGTGDENSDGLGLYICKQLADELRGKLWFESIENRGTTFFLSLDI